MQIIVRGHGTHVTPALREYALKKFKRLEHFLAAIRKVEVELNPQHIHDLEHRQSAKVTVWVPGAILHKVESGKDMYASIDIAFNKISTVVKKYKEKHFSKTHKGKEKRRRVLASAES